MTAYPKEEVGTWFYAYGTSTSILKSATGVGAEYQNRIITSDVIYGRPHTLFSSLQGLTLTDRLRFST